MAQLERKRRVSQQMLCDVDTPPILVAYHITPGAWRYAFLTPAYSLGSHKKLLGGLNTPLGDASAIGAATNTCLCMFYSPLWYADNCMS